MGWDLGWGGIGWGGESGDVVGTWRGVRGVGWGGGWDEMGSKLDDGTRMRLDTTRRIHEGCKDISPESGHVAHRGNEMLHAVSQAQPLVRYWALVCLNASAFSLLLCGSVSSWQFGVVQAPKRLVAF